MILVYDLIFYLFLRTKICSSLMELDGIWIAWQRRKSFVFKIHPIIYLICQTFFYFLRVFLIFCHICVKVDVATSQLPVSFGGKQCTWMIASFCNGCGALCKDFSPFAFFHKLIYGDSHIHLKEGNLVFVCQIQIILRI